MNSDSTILTRQPDSRYSVVSPCWQGHTVACLGGGPSLTQGDIRRVVGAGCKIIAVNDAYRLCSIADICYFADSEWWTWHKDKIGFQYFVGQKCSIQHSGANIVDDAVHMLRNKTHPRNSTGLSLDPACLMTGSNSGYQAVNLAVLAGAKTIILLGYDAHTPAAGEKTHWFGDHPRREPDAVYNKYRQSHRDGARMIKTAGVRVINCSPGSAITDYENRTLPDALNEAFSI